MSDLHDQYARALDSFNRTHNTRDRIAAEDFYLSLTAGRLRKNTATLADIAVCTRILEDRRLAREADAEAARLLQEYNTTPTTDTDTTDGDPFDPL